MIIEFVRTRNGVKQHTFLQLNRQRISNDALRELTQFYFGSEEPPLWWEYNKFMDEWEAKYDKR
jgi:hypothetical protein